MSRTALSRPRQPSWPFLLHTVLGGDNVILPIVKTRKLRLEKLFAEVTKLVSQD